MKRMSILCWDLRMRTQFIGTHLTPPPPPLEQLCGACCMSVVVILLRFQQADCHPFMFSRELSQYAIHDVQKTERNPEDGPCSDIIELIDIVEGNFYSGRELYECICEKSIQLTDIERYCRDLTTICHKNIAKFVGFFIDKEKGYPVFVKDRLEINLENLLETKFENLPEKVLLFPLKLNIMLDTAKALKYLHHDYSKAPVVHGQVTAWNVYINGINGNSATAKLANLENYISRGIYPNHINRKSLQTIVYMPPEVTSDTDKIYTPAVDIFSFGHLTLYVITGKEPQLQSSHSVIRKSEVEKRKSDMNPMYDNFGHGHELVQLVEKCLCDKRNSRYSIMYTEVIRPCSKLCMDKRHYNYVFFDLKQYKCTSENYTVHVHAH